MCFHNFIHNKAHVRCETNNNILLFYPFVQDANDSPNNKILSNDNYIYSLTATACIACLTNWVSMTELNCTAQGFGPQPWQINIYYSI